MFPGSLEAFLAEAKLTPDECADAIGVHRATIYRWLRGESWPHRSHRTRLVEWAERVAKRRRIPRGKRVRLEAA